MKTGAIGKFWKRTMDAAEIRSKLRMSTKSVRTVAAEECKRRTREYFDRVKSVTASSGLSDRAQKAAQVINRSFLGAHERDTVALVKILLQENITPLLWSQSIPGPGVMLKFLSQTISPGNRVLAFVHGRIETNWRSGMCNNLEDGRDFCLRGDQLYDSLQPTDEEIENFFRDAQTGNLKLIATSQFFANI